MRAVLPLVLLAACGKDDLDFDGFLAGDDCDDLDPLVYPGAPDDPGDGIDSDCSGGDAGYAFFGDWTVTSFHATTGGVDFIVSDETTGTLSLAEDFSAAVDVDAALDPTIVGFEFSIEFSLQGTASPVAGGRDRFVVYADGEVLGELVHFDWDCGLEPDDTLACAGEVKALDTSLLGDAAFTRL